MLQCSKQFIKVFKSFIFLFAHLIHHSSYHVNRIFALLYYTSSTQLSCKFSIFRAKRSKCNSILVNSTLSTKLADFRTCHKYYYIRLGSTFHYPNRHDLPNWTFAYSTIEIGHRTLDPPASNRKSVLISIVKTIISTLSIIHKYRHTSVYSLFSCTFKDRNRLHMAGGDLGADLLGQAGDSQGLVHLLALLFDGGDINHQKGQGHR